MSEHEIISNLVGTVTALKSGLSAAMVEVKYVLDGLENRFAKEAAAMMPAIREGVRLLEYWDEQEANLLREYVGARGLIVPMSLMSFPDFAELVTAHEQGGGPAVVVRLRQYYDDTFSRPAFLDELERAWVADVRLARRLPLLSPALDAHREGKYALSIPVLLAQFEGLVVEMAANPPRKFTHADLLAHVERVTAEDDGAGVALSSFVKHVFLAKFRPGSTIPPFSRHAILHGGDLDYATESNARTAILAIEEIRDYLPKVSSPSPKEGA
jgi:hypothetical protein